MMAQAGGYSASGRSLTARNAVASQVLTRPRRAAIAVTSITAVPSREPHPGIGQRAREGMLLVSG
jgi:hypothetical protein